MDGKSLLLGHMKSTRMRQRFVVRVVVTLIAFALVLTLLYVLACRWQLAGGDVDDWVNGAHRGVTQKFQVARRCIEPSQFICVTVTDLIDEFSNTAKRVLHTVNVTAPIDDSTTVAVTGRDRMWSVITGENLESIVSLIPPAGRTTSDSDTRLWAVNHTTVDWQHTAAMLVAPLAVGALTVPSSAEGAGSAVLVLGMGGGTLDMFLSERFPQMNISVIEMSPLVVQLAHEWFDVRETAHRRTTVGDARRAVDDAFGRGDLYDVIILDACNLDGDMPCPDAKLLEPSALRQMRAIVKPTGALVINVLPLAHECDNLKRVHRLVTAHFPTCAAAYFRAERNTVLVCTPYAITADIASVRGAWTAAWRRAARALDLGAQVASTSTHFQLVTSANGNEFRRAKFDAVTEC